MAAKLLPGHPFFCLSSLCAARLIERLALLCAMLYVEFPHINAPLGLNMVFDIDYKTTRRHATKHCALGAALGGGRFTY